MDTTPTDRSPDPRRSRRAQITASRAGHTPRTRRRTIVGLVLFALATALMVVSASAAPPAFPDNIIVFPNRDFISTQTAAGGVFDANQGPATVEVTRPNVGVVGGTDVTIGPSDVPFEVNHPGGYCWGIGNHPNVTPDILPGDVVTVRVANGDTVDVVTQDAYVTGINYTPGSNTFTVVGHIGPNVNPDNIEQRIVNPDLTDTSVGRRDVAAVPGPLTADRNNSYLSGLTVTGDTFTATYEFNVAGEAAIAATGGGVRLLSWETTDAAANRQGITIAEFDQLGGPGMGGCPNGPLTSGPAGPTGVTAVNLSPTSIKVDWTPAVAVPGTPAITGYRVTAVARTVTGGEQVEIGRRISGQAATGTTITGLASGETYDIEVVSISSAGATLPAIGATPVVDGTAPTVSADPPGATYPTAQQVSLSANELNSQIFYSTNGDDILDSAGQLALLPGITHYTGQITIDQDTTLKFVAFDPAGNASAQGVETYIISAQALAPGKPTITSSSSANSSITLAWSIDPAYVVTSYDVHIRNADNSFVQTLTPDPQDATTMTVTGLTNGVGYYLTVTASNVVGAGPASAEVGPITPHAATANAGPDQTITRGAAPTTVTLNGAGSSVGPNVTYKWTQVGATNPVVTLTGDTTLTPSFSLPVYSVGMVNTLTFELAVTETIMVGGVATPSTVKDTVVVSARDTLAATRVQWKSGEIRIEGTGSAEGANLTLTFLFPNGSTSTATASVVAGAWSVRLKSPALAATTKPTSFTVQSSAGGTLGPVTVP